MTHVLKLIKNRTTEIFPLSVTLKKEGERAVDSLNFECRKSDDISVNDRIETLFDFVSVEGLSAAYCFQGGVNDESTNQNHGTATGITYESESDFYGKQAVFNGTTAFASVADSDTLDLSGVFDIFVWTSWTSITEKCILSKRSSNTNGFALNVNATLFGDVKFYIGSDTITSSVSGLNDGAKHLIRIKRDSSNLITMYVDGTSVGTVNSSYDPTNTYSMLIGKDYSSRFYIGKMLRLRIYKGENKSDLEASQIYTQINPRSILKFGGYVTKIDLELVGKKITCQSYGKILAEKDVRGELYSGQTPEYIVGQLIQNNTDFSYNDRNIASGITISNFIADGKLYDLITDFASYTNRIFYTTPAEEFFFEPISFNDTGKQITHGSVGALIEKSAYDDSKLVNSVTLIGEKQSYTTTESFSGNAVDTVFTLEFSATSLNVKISGVEQEPDGVDYEVDSLQKEITFTSPPASGTNNIVVEYNYEIPLVIKGEKPASIAQYGIHSKRFNLNWINNRSDGVRFVASYLNRYSEVNQNVSVKFGNPILYFNENDVINVKNEFLGIDTGYVIKSIEWTYPELNTELTVGEYRFDYFDNDKEIIKKIHDYETSLTQNKDIQDYESPEEIIALVDTIIKYTIDEYTETLSITDTSSKIEKDVAVYGTSTYGSRTTGDVYGSWVMK